MPGFTPSLIPSIPAGNLFSRFMTDLSLNIRWLVLVEPVYYEVVNRPIADTVLRTLILAKTVDELSATLGHQALFPFLVRPHVGFSSDQAEIPQSWIWDLQITLPAKWKQVRLARIKRLSGENGTTSGYTGRLRLIFTASQMDNPAETALLVADYAIDSALTFQLVSLTPPVPGEEGNNISVDEASTVAGNICFRTLDTSELLNSTFLEIVAPPVPPTDSNSDGFFDSPAVYDIVDSPAGGVTSEDDFSLAAVAHGSGLLTESAVAPMPSLNTDIQDWLNSFNFPFDATANRTSTSGIQIPIGLFREFDLCVPAGDEPTGSASGLYFPVWLSRIALTAINQLTLYFSTHNTTETETGGTPSLQAIEFATMVLPRTSEPGDVVAIAPASDLKLRSGNGLDNWGQHFGRGHAVLSSVWDNDSVITDLYDAFAAILDNPQDSDYSQSSGRISCFGLSRVPKYTPTIGQSRALLGSTSRLVPEVNPSADNRYVCEQDQGLGNTVDLEALPGITPVDGLERYGNTGALAHRVVRMIVDGTKLDNQDATFYDQNVLPRLRALLGRDPQFGDHWFNGSKVFFYTGDVWITS